MNIHDYETERGHSLKPEAELLAQIPALYATDGVPLDQKVVYVAYFAGACSWYLMELDQEEWLAFGWCDLGHGFPELGYFSLHELGSVEASGRVRFIGEGGEVTGEGTMPIYVERDLYFTPKPFSEIERS